MRKRVALYKAAMFGLAFPVAAYAVPQAYTDTQGDEAGSTNAARDIYSASVDDDGTNLYFTINLNPAANLITSNFNYGIGFTTGLPGAGGDTQANATTHGNPYTRTISIDPSLGGMLDWVGLFPAGSPTFTGYAYNDYTWTGTTWTQKSSAASGVPFNKQGSQTGPSSIAIAIPIVDFAGNLPLSLGSTFKFDIYSTGTSAGQTAYDSLADASATNGTGGGTGSSTVQYNGTVLDSYTMQGTSPLSLVWNNSSAIGTADGATWDSALNGTAGGSLNQNWLDGTTPFFFFPNNAVTFNDSNNGHYAVTLNSTVKPAAVTVANSAGNYSISGTGSIAGTGGIAKSGTGSLTLSTSNTFTGGLNISGGTVIIANTDALGFAARLTAGQVPGATIIGPGGTLDLNSRSLTEPITMNGGTLTNSNASAASLTLGIKGVAFTGSTGPFSADAAINLTGGGGSGALAKVVLSLSQASLNLGSKGSGYSSVPTVTIAGGGGSSATATATLGISANSVNITNGGAYTVAPNITITGGGGTGATATAILTGGAVTGINVTNPGTGYTTAPTFNISGGTFTTAATDTGNATNFVVNGLTLGNAGLNFNAIPMISFSGGGSGTGAAATVLDSHFSLLGIQTTAGSGYGSVPTATFAATTGSLTTGTVVPALFSLAADSSIGGPGNISITGPINGVGGLIKIGGDTLDLSGSNAYSGATNVSNGTLTIDATGSLASVNASVAIGATMNVLVGGGLSSSTALTDNGIVNLNNPTHTIASLNGSGALNLNSTALTITGGGTFSGVIADNGTPGSVTVGGGTLTLSGSNTYTGGTTASAGMLILASNGALPANQSLAIASGATVQASLHTGGPSSVNVLKVSSLTNSGSLDLTNNDIDIHSGMTLSQVTGQVGAAFNGGTWTGSSATGVITSSAAAADMTFLTAVGVLLNNDGAGNQIWGSGTTLGLFEGTINPALNDILVKYTYYGDTNLDGAVDGSDYTNIDAGFNEHLTGWQNGDFNYDGIVDGSDYTLIDNAFNTQGATLGTNPTELIASSTAQTAGGSSAVPEPATLGLLGIAAIGLLGRRRRFDRSLRTTL